MVYASLQLAFNNQLDYFDNDEFIDFAEEAFLLFPSIFLTAPSSASGKYHPEDERGEGGQVLHTKRVMWACSEVAKALSLGGALHDCFILAGMLHDVDSKFVDSCGNLSTDPLHPLKPRERFKELAKIIGQANYDLTMELVECHSGIWSPSPRLIPDQEELIHWAFHLCDYFVSRSNVFVKVE